jgi:hypothetical protein
MQSTRRRLLRISTSTLISTSGTLEQQIAYLQEEQQHFYKAMIMITTKKYDDSFDLIQKARLKLNFNPNNVQYPKMVRIQQLQEMEEILGFKKLQESMLVDYNQYFMENR